MPETPNYEIDYENEQFKKVESDKAAALDANEKLYGDMLAQNDKFYDDQVTAAKDYAAQQTDLQNQQNELALKEIEQNKQKQERDYQREQSAAYVDWQKHKNDYGVNAEQEAANGLSHSGFAESSQVSFYNTYQNRVMKARESYQDAVQKFDLSMSQARLQNNVKLAEIAFQTLQKSLELALQGFQAKNTLLLDQANKKMQIDSLYEQRRQSVIDQIMKEYSLAEQVRQFNESMDFQIQRYNDSRASSGGGGGYYRKSSGSSKSSSSNSLKTDRTPPSGDTVSEEWLKTNAARALASGENPTNVQRTVAANTKSAASADTVYRAAVATANKVNNINNQYMASQANSTPKKSTVSSALQKVAKSLAGKWV